MHPQRFRRVTTALRGWKSRLNLSKITPTRWIVVLVGLSFALQLSGLAHAGTTAADGEEATMRRSPNQAVELAQRAPAQVEVGSVSAHGSAFIENLGQFEPQVQFQMVTQDGYLIVTEDALWIVSDTPLPAEAVGVLSEGPAPESTPSPDGEEAMEAARQERRRLAHLKVQFPESEAPFALEPFDPVESNIAFIKGDDPARWVSDAPVWRGVRLHNLAPGYVLELRGAEGAWTWDLVEVPQPALQDLDGEAPPEPAQAPELALSLSGADSLSVENGTIRAEVEGERLEVELPSVVSEDRSSSHLPEASLEGDQLTIDLSPPAPDESGSTLPQSARLAINRAQPASSSGRLLSLAPEARSAQAAEALPLYSILLGGGVSERANAIVQHPGTGEVFVTGRSRSFLIITQDGVLVDEQDDVYVLRITPQGEVVTITYVGGDQDDHALDMKILDSGELILVGRTDSDDFPTTADGFQRDRSGLIDAFVIMLSPSTVGLEYGSFFGGTGFDYAYGLASDPERPTRIYFTGMTTSSEASFPLRNPIDGVHDGVQDAYLVQFDVSRSGAAALEFSTYLGGSDSDQGHDLALGPDGTIYVTGQTHSDDFLLDLASQRSFDRSYNGLWDSFLIGVDSASRAVSFGSYLGGEGHDCERAGDFRECRIVVDPGGRVYLAGMTGSDSFPTTAGVYQRDKRGADDIYITVLDPGLDGQAALVRSTLAGGGGDDLAFGLAVSGAGQPVVVGRTTSDDLELTQENAIRTAFAGGHEAFALAFSSDFSRLLYGTYIGGDSPDGATPVLIDPSGNLHVAGFTFSSDFFVTHGDDEIDGISDAFVVGLDPGLPAGAAVSVAVVDPDGEPVSSLVLNSDGWPTPNPLKVTVTITCPAAGNECSSSFDLELSGGGVGRYYVYEATLPPDATNCVGDAPAQQATYLTYSISCQAIFLQPGDSIIHAWQVWVQPSKASSFRARASYATSSHQRVVNVPQAKIYPVVIIPGLFGSWKNFTGQWVVDPLAGRYDTILQELEFVGYEANVSLFTFPYDWRQHIDDSGVQLGQAIDRFLSDASSSGRGYVRTDSIDLVGHSLGGLVSRAYIQGETYDHDVRRLVTLGTPHLGAAPAYLGAEGLVQISEGFIVLRWLKESLVSHLAMKAGYCTVGIRPLPPRCWPTHGDIYHFIQDRIPSAREIFPDRRYLTPDPGGYLVEFNDPSHTYPYGVQVNGFLEGLNNDVGNLVSRLGVDNTIPVVGERFDQDTDRFYRVVERDPEDLPLWANGKVPAEDQFRIQGPGDGTVASESADLGLVDPRISSLMAQQADDQEELVHGNMPTQLQLTSVELLTGVRPGFDAGFRDPLFRNPLLFFNLSPVEIQVIDPLGRKSGVAFDSVTELSEIPGATFWRSGVPEEPDFLYINDPVEGEYTIKLLGVEHGDYVVGLESLGEGGRLTLAVFPGSSVPGERYEHTVMYDQGNLPQLPLQLEWQPPLESRHDPVEIGEAQSLPIKFTVTDSTGAFVADRGVSVWIVDPDVRGSTVAAFSSGGLGDAGKSDIVRIDEDEEMYVVNLHARNYELERGKTYIVGVHIFGQQLSTIAIRVVSPGRK